MYYKINNSGKSYVLEAPSLAYATYYFIESQGYESLESDKPDRSFFSVEPLTENPTVDGVPYKEALAEEMDRIAIEWERDYCENLDLYSWCDSLDDVCPILELDEESDSMYLDGDILMVKSKDKAMPLAEFERVADINI